MQQFDLFAKFLTSLKPARRLLKILSSGWRRQTMQRSAGDGTRLLALISAMPKAGARGIPTPAEVDITPFIAGVRSGDRASLARAITLVESKRPDHRKAARRLVQGLLPA